MRIIFFGTPEVAVPTLKKLIAEPGMQVVAVVCQPDRPAGRGNKINKPATKIVAEEHNIPVLQPVRLSKSPDIVEQMRLLNADIIVMVAFGQILKKEVLELTPHGVVNLHFSLLPKYRGAAPYNWAIIKGETKTGVTTLFTELGVDTGPMLLKREMDIDQDMTSAELGSELSIIGADLMVETLKHFSGISQRPIPQDHEQASMAPLLSKEMGNINWSRPAVEIHNLVRGLIPWPGTWTNYKGNTLKILKTKLASESEKITDRCGIIHLKKGHVYVACGKEEFELLELIEVQPASGKRMSASNWAMGARLQSGERLGDG